MRNEGAFIKVTWVWLVVVKYLCWVQRFKN